MAISSRDISLLLFKENDMKIMISRFLIINYTPLTLQHTLL